MATELQEQRKAIVLADAMASLAAMTRHLPEGECGYLPIASGHALFYGPDDPANRVLGFESSGLADQIELLEQFYQDRKAEVRIAVANRLEEQKFIDFLLGRDYKVGPIMDTWWRSTEPLPVLDHEIAISRVRAEEGESWARALAAGFRETDAPVNEADLNGREVTVHKLRAFAENSYPFVALRSGEFAGGAVAHLNGQIALLRTTSTRFNHRRNGIHQALIAHRLGFASASGCRIAFSMANKASGSERNMQSMGFSLLQEGCLIFKT